MLKRSLILLAAAFFLAGPSSPVSANNSADSAAADQMIQLMPKTTDTTTMWWKDGFAGVVDGADWRRYTRTGNYWFLFDTDKIEIPRLGSVKAPADKITSADLSIKIEVDGKVYCCQKGVDWSTHAGPRLIESGRFLQRTDVNGLVFTAKDGTRLNAEARFETVAWPDHLGLTLAARPGKLPLQRGEKAGGRFAGGYGLTGENVFQIPAKHCHVPGDFSLSFWVFIEGDHAPGKFSAWLVCKNKHESAPGNFGISLSKRALAPIVHINTGTRKDLKKYRFSSTMSLRSGRWNHLAMSYHRNQLQLYVNGALAVDEKVSGKRSDVEGSLTFGGRGDGNAGYEFRGVIDEVALFRRALKVDELKQLRRRSGSGTQKLRPLKTWSFSSNVPAIAGVQRDSWKKAALEIELNQDRRLRARWEGRVGNSDQWKQTHLMVDPVSMTKVPPQNPKVTVRAVEKGSTSAQKVTFEPNAGWYRIDLNGVIPRTPNKKTDPSNDALERVKLTLANPTDQEQVLRLMFEKTSNGIKQKIGQPITGISAVLRDSNGNPTGIPVQLSKNWHNDPKGGAYASKWFHGVSQIRMPPRQSVELELVLAYGHWGGLPAVSHSQLSLIGYGSNQLWDQSALGAWGESICYSPEQSLGGCIVTDVRPLMVKGMKQGEKWAWTSNVGGADFLRLTTPDGDKLFMSQLKTNYQRTGPCLSEVHYDGRIGQTGIRTRVTSSLSRTDDIVRATYRVRMRASKKVDFKRFVLFQTGADSYTFSRDQKLAYGDAGGLGRQWNATPGGDQYRGKPIRLTGDSSWVSLHDAKGRKSDAKFWANRGFVIRRWEAKLGGKKADPWVAERGIKAGKTGVTTMDLLPPPRVKKLLPGDFVDMTLEFLVVPQFADEYYGPNQALKSALKKHENTWRMIQREASEGALDVVVTTGKIQRLYPGVEVVAENDGAEFELRGGVGFVPITFSGLKSHAGYRVLVNGEVLDQSVHGNDFWQTDFDSKTKTWQQTYNIRAPGVENAKIVFEPN